MRKAKKGNECTKWKKFYFTTYDIKVKYSQPIVNAIMRL